MRWTLAVAVILSAHPAPAQNWEQGCWVSTVPESSAGFVLAQYMQDTLVVMMSCSPVYRGLQVSVTEAPLKTAYPPYSLADTLIVRAGGVSHSIPAAQRLPETGDFRDVENRWPGQEAFVQALLAGAPLEVLIVPAAEPGREILAARVPGQPNSPGLAHVNEMCAGGPKVRGIVETVPDLMEGQLVGDWWLRRRGENFPMPVATVTSENGSGLGLFCDSNGQPAGYVGYVGLPADGEQVEFSLLVGGYDFRMTGTGWKGFTLFPLTPQMSVVLAASSEAFVRAEGQPTMRFSTRDAPSAIAHAHGGCGGR